jgi:hypothetical protein
MKRQIHPRIWETIVKAYEFVYDEKYLSKLLSSLDLSKQYIEDSGKNLRTQKIEFLNSLSFEDGLKVVKDALDDGDIKKLRYDNWNCSGDFVKTWRPDIISALESSGIIYDEEKKSFSFKGPGDLIIPVVAKEELVKSQFDDIFYNNLKKEINLAYGYGLFTAAFILSRKMIENLVIDVLRLKYPANVSGNLAIYWQAKQPNAHGRHHDFTILLKNLDEGKDDFVVDKGIVVEFLRLVAVFRPISNSNAHSIIIISEEKDLIACKIDRIVELMLKLKQILLHETKISLGKP